MSGATGPATLDMTSFREARLHLKTAVRETKFQTKKQKKVVHDSPKKSYIYS